MTFNEVPVRGMYFRGSDVVALVDTLQVGTKLDLEREPDNAHDAFAIKVLFESTHIGYLGAEYASWIAPHMDEGQSFTATITSLAEGKKGHSEPICLVTSDG